MAKGTKFTYGGFMQLDAIASEYSDGKPNQPDRGFLRAVHWFRWNRPMATRIPIHRPICTPRHHGSFFTTKTNTDAGAISTRIELDFILSGQG